MTILYTRHVDSDGVTTFRPASPSTVLEAAAAALRPRATRKATWHKVGADGASRMRAMHKQGAGPQDLARQFGVSEASVYAILRGDSYRDAR